MPDLGQFLKALALSTIEAQRELDRQYLSGIESHARTGSPLRQSLLALQPGMRIERNTVSARFLVRKAKTTGFSIGVQNLNLRYHIAHQTAREMENSLEFAVEQIPAPGTPKT